MESFEGYEDATAFWADMKVEMLHGGDFSRVAMVVDQKWIEWGAKVTDLVMGADLKWFGTNDRGAAIAWARAER